MLLPYLIFFKLIESELEEIKNIKLEIFTHYFQILFLLLCSYFNLGLNVNERIKKNTHIFIVMEEKTTIHMVTVLGLMATGLVFLASIASSAATVYAQANNNTSPAAGGGNMTNATAGSNQSAANSTNPLAKVPVIGKLFGGK